MWAGEATNDAFAPLRAPKLTLATTRKAAENATRRGRRFGGRRGGAQATVQGRWSLTSTLFRREAAPTPAAPHQAELLLERYGIVTREQVLAEGIPGGFSSLYDCWPRWRRSGSAGAATSSRAWRCAVRAAGRGRAVARAPIRRRAAGRARRHRPRPALRGGFAVAEADTTRRRPARAAGAYVVLAGAEPVVFVERGGKRPEMLVEPDDARLRPALAALADFVRERRTLKLALERIDGEPVVGSARADPDRPRLPRGPRKLTLSA